MSNEDVKVPTFAYPEVFYPEGIDALKEHLKQGVAYEGFESLDMSDLLTWLSGLLDFNGQFSISVNELIFRFHIENYNPVVGKFATRALSKDDAMGFLFLLGKDRCAADRLYEKAIKKLTEANLIRVVTRRSRRTKKRKGWKKDIPGLSRKLITCTVVNKEKLSFDEFLSRVRALD